MDDKQQQPGTEPARPTCLHDRHVAAGALMSPFAGFDMPISYEGIIEEHNAVRTACGVFDVSHMGEVVVAGPGATPFVNYIFTNDVRAIAPGQILYGMMLNDEGGTVDDLLVYRLSESSYLLVINASNIAKDVAWIRSHAEGYDVTVDDISDTTAELAIQGPDSEEVMRRVAGVECSDLAFYTFRTVEHPRLGRLLVSRTGYTGEDGFEVYASADAIISLWDMLMESGACKPCGLGCRDTLRFEVGLPLYGDELDEDISPVEASLSMFVKLDKPEFVGREAVARQKAEGPARKSVGLLIEGRGVARHGCEVLAPDSDTVIGYVTTGYRGISVDRSLAVALIDSRYAAKDTPVRVRVRRKVFDAVVAPRRFYKKSYKK